MLNITQIMDALGGLFNGLIVLHFKQALEAVANNARANLRRWTANAALLIRFAMGAALKPVLAAYLVVFLLIALVGAMTTAIPAVELPAGWIALYIATVLSSLVVGGLLLAYTWNNQALPSGEVERIERQLRQAAALNIPALWQLENRIAERLERTYGGRAPLLATILLISLSFLLLGAELVYLSTWFYRWETDLRWQLTIATALIGCFTIYLGANVLRLPIQLAGIVANELDAPLDWGINFLIQTGLILFPGYTVENVKSRVKELNAPLEKVGAFLAGFGAAAMSALRYLIGVTLVMNNPLWTGCAALIGFVAGLGRTEQTEIGKIDVQPQLTKAATFFWGPRGIFVQGMVVRVLWTLLTTPAHAATAPTGPDTPLINPDTGLTQVVPSSDGRLMQIAHHLLELPFWHGLAGAAQLAVLSWFAFIGFFSGTEAADGKSKGITRVAWIIIGVLSLPILVASALTVVTIIAGWIGVALKLIPPHA